MKGRNLAWVFVLIVAVVAAFGMRVAAGKNTCQYRWEVETIERGLGEYHNSEWRWLGEDE